MLELFSKPELLLGKENPFFLRKEETNVCNNQPIQVYQHRKSNENNAHLIFQENIPLRRKRFVPVFADLDLFVCHHEKKKKNTYICFSSRVYISQSKESTTKYYYSLQLFGKGRIPFDCLIKIIVSI